MIYIKIQYKAGDVKWMPVTEVHRPDPENVDKDLELRHFGGGSSLIPGKDYARAWLMSDTGVTFESMHGCYHD